MGKAVRRLAEIPELHLAIQRVGLKVGSYRKDEPKLIEPVE